MVRYIYFKKRVAHPREPLKLPAARRANVTARERNRAMKAMLLRIVTMLRERDGGIR